jgi:hypothetical protein
MEGPIIPRAVCDWRFHMLNRSHLSFLISVTPVALLLLPRTALMSPEKGKTGLLWSYGWGRVCTCKNFALIFWAGRCTMHPIHMYLGRKRRTRPFFWWYGCPYGIGAQTRSFLGKNIQWSGKLEKNGICAHCTQITHILLKNITSKLSFKYIHVY